MAENNYKTAIVNSSTFGRYFSDLMDRLREIGEVERFEFKPKVSGKKLAEALQGYDFIIASVTPQFSREFFEKNDSVKLIARHGIGYDNVDIEAASENEVIVTRVLGVHERDAVAELALGLIMTCIRDILPAQEAVISGNWENRRNFVGMEVSKKTVGIIGYGNIGSRTAEILKEGFKTEVLAYDPYIANAVIEKNGIQPVSFDEIIQKSDILSLHASLNENNYHFIGREEFELMKDEVVIVNTARGELMIEEELAQAVKDDKVGAVGLDVAQEEPMPVDNPLVGLEKVIIVPHIGGYTDYSLREMDEKMVVDIENYIEGKELDQVVNPEVLR